MINQILSQPIKIILILKEKVLNLKIKFIFYKKLKSKNLLKINR